MKRRVEPQVERWFGKEVARIADGRWQIARGAWVGAWQGPEKLASAITFYEKLVAKRPSAKSYAEAVEALHWIKGELNVMEETKA